MLLDVSFIVFFFFKQKTAYDMRISDWSSDVCSSDLGMARQRLGPAQADGQLRDLQRVQKGEGLRLAALEVEREGRSRARAMATVYVGLPLGLRKAEIDDLLHLRLVLQPGADPGGILARPAHAQFQRLQRPQQHPGRIDRKSTRLNSSH